MMVATEVRRPVPGAGAPATGIGSVHGVGATPARLAHCGASSPAPGSEPPKGLSLHVDEPSLEPLEVSVILPCLNEAETLATCVQKAVKCLDELGVPGEVLVSDNGSTDGSQQIAEEYGAR